MAKKLIRTRDDVDALKAGDKPYAVATSIRNVRVHVAPSGRKTFQMRRNGTMVTLGPVADLSFKDLQRIAVTGETPAEVEQRTRRIEHWIASYEAATSLSLIHI